MNKKKLTIAIIIILLIIIASISVLFILNRQDNKNIKEPDNLEEIKNILNQYQDNIGNIENLSYNSKYNNNYKFNQTYNNIDVFSGGIVATIENNEISNLINYNYEIPDNFNVKPINTENDLLNIAKDYLSNKDLTLNSSRLIIYPISATDFTLAYLYDFNVGDVIVSDSDKTVLASSNIFNETEKSIIDQTNENYYNYFVENGKEVLNEDEIEKYKQMDGTYTLTDTTRNIEFYKIKDSYSEIPSDEFLEKNTDYYTNIKWNNIYEANSKDNYYAVRAMQNIVKVYDYYKNIFGFQSIKGEEEYKLKIFTNTVHIGNKDFTDNAALARFNDDDMRIYLGASNTKNEKIEVLAHEYTHGFFNTIVHKFDDTETYAINEAYSDIMGMIIKAYYSNNSKIDGIYDSNGGENFERKIKDSNLSYNDFNDNMEGHEASMILSKAAYMMSINENLNLSLDDLAKLWFYSLYKLPNYIVHFTDVEKAILLEAKELGYSDKDIKEMSNIFVKLGYPDYYKQCTSEECVNARKIEKLDKDIAVSILQKQIGNWKDNIQVDYEYVTVVKDKNENVYYAINAYSHKNYMNNGGEWLEDLPDGRFYVCTYYVRTTYTENKVFVGQNQRDYEKFEEGDTVEFFMNTYYLNVNETNKEDSTTDSLGETKTDFKVGSATVKYGTYKGTAAATGDTLVLKSDGTATLNGKSYNFTVGKYDFAQDISSIGSYEDAIILKNSDGTTYLGLYVYNGRLCNDPMEYVYSGN